MKIMAECSESFLLDGMDKGFFGLQEDQPATDIVWKIFWAQSERQDRKSAIFWERNIKAFEMSQAIRYEFFEYALQNSRESAFRVSAGPETPNKSLFYMERLCETEHGGLGIPPPLTRPGDKICVLDGYSRLAVLRPGDDHFIFLGHCFIDGLMNGQPHKLISMGKLRKQYFNIR
jgi:hypothetical protein